jgi:hypothetical protein
MTRTTLLIPLAASLMLGTAAFAQTSMQSSMDPRQSAAGGMPIDQETSINGIQAACTGVGDSAEDSARWSSYPVKLVVAGDHGQYYAGEHVSISGRRGQQVADMTCNGPWVLMRLEPGAYRATVDLPGHAAKTISFTAPASGQHEVTVHFASNDEDFGGRNEHRATETNYTQPRSKPMNDTTYGNGATDQPPQQPQ